MGLERINEFKQSLNMTNEELSEKSGVPKSTIDKITSGRTYNPNLETVKALVYALGITLNDLDDIDEKTAAQGDGFSPERRKFINEVMALSEEDFQLVYDIFRTVRDRKGKQLP